MAAAAAPFLGIAQASPPPLEAASINGFWRPPPGGRIEIMPCGERLCGYVRDDGDGEPEIHPGHMLLVEMEYQGNMTWAHGKIHNPRDNRIYDGKLRLLNGNRLKLTGCLWIFCGSQIWTRIE
jgi:uncharacterized protein (DUF2147 family)